jgi:hypothetical protein
VTGVVPVHVLEEELEQARRVALCERIAVAVVDEERCEDVVSALLSVAAAYIRVADPEHRLSLAKDAGRLIVDNVRASLD